MEEEVRENTYIQKKKRKKTKMYAKHSFKV